MSGRTHPGMHPPWKKGQSGNPGGRRRMDPLVVAKIREWTPELAERLKALAMKADTDGASINAIKLLWAYVFSPPQAQADEGEGIPENPLDRLTVEELRALARQSLAADAKAEADEDAGDDDADETGAH